MISAGNHWRLYELVTGGGRGASLPHAAATKSGKVTLTMPPWRIRRGGGIGSGRPDGRRRENSGWADVMSAQFHGTLWVLRRKVMKSMKPIVVAILSLVHAF